MRKAGTGAGQRGAEERCRGCRECQDGVEGLAGGGGH